MARRSQSQNRPWRHAIAHCVTLQRSRGSGEERCSAPGLEHWRKNADGENEAWHDCLLKRSTDNGDTWSAATIIYSESAGWKGLSKGNANSTIGNCEAVADLVTGDVFVFMYVSVLYTLSGSQSQPTTFVILACALLTNDACSCWVSCFKGLTTIAELCCQNR